MLMFYVLFLLIIDVFQTSAQYCYNHCARPQSIYKPVIYQPSPTVANYPTCPVNYPTPAVNYATSSANFPEIVYGPPLLVNVPSGLSFPPLQGMELPSPPGQAIFVDRSGNGESSSGCVSRETKREGCARRQITLTLMMIHLLNRNRWCLHQYNRIQDMPQRNGKPVTEATDSESNFEQETTKRSKSSFQILTKVGSLADSLLSGRIFL